VPRTKGRSLAVLSAVMQFPVMTKDKTLLEQILLLERLSDEYTKSAGHQIAPDILLSTLVRILPKNVQRHVQSTMTEDETYSQVREQVLAHERISSTWSKDRVMADINGTALGTVTSYATGDSGVAPMEINQVKGKSKGKGQRAKEHRKGKEKTKANRKMVAKGKGKSQQGGKHSQRPLMFTDATTVVPWDTGNEIAANFRLIKPMVLFDELKLMDHLNMQHHVQAVLEQRNSHPVLQHIVLQGMSTVLPLAIAL